MLILELFEELALFVFNKHLKAQGKKTIAKDTIFTEDLCFYLDNRKKIAALPKEARDLIYSSIEALCQTCFCENGSVLIARQLEELEKESPENYNDLLPKLEKLKDLSLQIFQYDQKTSKAKAIKFINVISLPEIEALSQEDLAISYAFSSFPQSLLLDKERIRILSKYRDDSRLLVKKNKTVAETLDLAKLKQILLYIDAGKSPSAKTSRVSIGDEIIETANNLIGDEETIYMETLRKLPDTVYLAISKKKEKEPKILFKNFLACFSAQPSAILLKFLNAKQFNEACAVPFLQLVGNDKFWECEDLSKKELLLNEVAGTFTKKEISSDLVKVILDKNFPLKSDKLTSQHLEQITDFLYVEADEQRESRMKAILDIAAQLEKGEITIPNLERYLVYLKHGNKKNEAKQIAVKSAYFKNHSVQSFFETLDKSELKEELEKFLSLPVKKKQKKYYYKTIEKLSNYPKSVQEEIIHLLSNVETGKEGRYIYQSINRSKFINAAENQQHLVLAELPGQSLSLTGNQYELKLLDEEYVNDLLLPKEEIACTVKVKGKKLKATIKKSVGS